MGSLSSAGNNNSDLTPKFESSFDKTSDTTTVKERDNVFKCPNDMCRHNKVSSAMTTNFGPQEKIMKRKICLCGRTMLNQNSLLNSQTTTSAGRADSVKETSKQHATTEKFIP